MFIPNYQMLICVGNAAKAYQWMTTLAPICPFFVEMLKVGHIR